MIKMTEYNKREKTAFIDFIHNLYGVNGDLDRMYEEVHSESLSIRFKEGVSQRDAFTIAFCRKLDKLGILRLGLFFNYITEKDRYDICHRLCDDYIKVDWLWDCINVTSYGREGFLFEDINCKKLVVGKLCDTTILDYQVIPFYNYEEFYA